MGTSDYESVAVQRDKWARGYGYTLRTRLPAHRLAAVVILGASALALPVQMHAHGDTGSLLARFLAREDRPPMEYRALRHLSAHNDHFNADGWLEAWTAVDAQNGFHYEIVAEGGSGYIRSHVLKQALDAELRMWAARDPEKAALTPANYELAAQGMTSDGLASFAAKPRRKDVLLIEGSIYVDPEHADLQRIEGRLSKAPSFWTRRVEIVRRYARIGGVQVPIALETTASVLIAGRSTFKMTYEYETVNGERVGSPQVNER